MITLSQHRCATYTKSSPRSSYTRDSDSPSASTVYICFLFHFRIQCFPVLALSLFLAYRAMVSQPIVDRAAGSMLYIFDYSMDHLVSYSSLFLNLCSMPCFEDYSGRHKTLPLSIIYIHFYWRTWPPPRQIRGQFCSLHIIDLRLYADLYICNQQGSFLVNRKRHLDSFRVNQANQ